MSDNSFDDAMNTFLLLVYKEDRSMITEHLQHISEGKEKVHNLHYRWLDKNGMPLWINCRGRVIDDKDVRSGSDGFVQITKYRRFRGLQCV